MLDVEVIDDPETAVVALEPVRSRLLSELANPGSAATLATRVRLPRQKINYHLRALEARLVRLTEGARWPDGTVAGSDGIVLCGLARGARAGCRQSGSNNRSSGRELSHRAGRPRRSGGRRSFAPGQGCRQRACHARGGHGTSLPIGSGARCFHQRTDRGYHETRFKVPR